MRILVTAASKYGASTEIAARIAEVLTKRGLAVTVRPPEEVTSVAEFDAVVIGSGVYAGRWLGPARDLIDRCRGELRERNVWLFSSGPIGDPPKPEAEAPEAASLVAKSGARGHRVFAGRLWKADLSLPERLLVSALRSPEGDFRPWDDIVEYASQIADAVATRPEVTAARA